MINRRKGVVFIPRKQMLVFFLANFSLQKKPRQQENIKINNQTIVNFFWRKTFVGINNRSPKITAFSNFEQVVLGKDKEKTLQKIHIN